MLLACIGLAACIAVTEPLRIDTSARTVIVNGQTIRYASLRYDVSGGRVYVVPDVVLANGFE